MKINSFFNVKRKKKAYRWSCRRRLTDGLISRWPPPSATAGADNSIPSAAFDRPIIRTDDAVIICDVASPSESIKSSRRHSSPPPSARRPPRPPLPLRVPRDDTSALLLLNHGIRTSPTATNRRFVNWSEGKLIAPLLPRTG